MKTLSLAVLLAVASIPTQAADVGVSVSVGQPGFYGQLDIGGYLKELFAELVQLNNVRDTIRYNTSIDEGLTLDLDTCLLYTSPSPRDGLLSRMPSSA